MMFEEVCAIMYKYVMQAEFLFLQKFKLNPFELMKDITMLDLISYIKLLEEKIKKEEDSIQKKDFEKALIQLRDILIFMTLGKDGLRMKL